MLGSVYAGSEKYTMDQMYNEFFIALLILAVWTIIFGALLNYVSKKYCWYWYEALMKHHFPNWNKTLQDISNPSERLQDSTEVLVNLIFNMTKAVFHSALMLGVFGPKLWELSAKFNFFCSG